MPEPRIHTVALSGDIDLASRETMMSLLAELDGPCDVAVVDLRAVSYMDSTGMSALVGMKRRLRERYGAEVQLILGNHNMFRLLKACGLDRLFTIVLRPAQQQA